MIRKPIFISELAPVEGGEPVKRIFHLKRQTPVE
jgi:hypothetical protein